MKNKFTVAILCLTGAVFAEDAPLIKISSEPELPVKNLVTNGGFEEGLKGWGYVKPETTLVDGGYKSSKALRIAKMNAAIAGGEISFGKNIKNGKTYIVSCMIKPDPGFEKDAKEAGMYGLGAVVGLWTKDWKGVRLPPGTSLGVHNGGTSEWTLIRSKPVTIPEDAGVAQLWVGNDCNAVTGLIDDVAVYEAYAKIKLAITSKLPLQQIIVTNDAGKMIFDSGNLKDSPKEFSTEFQVETPYTYTIRVLDAEGGVTTKQYPEK